MHESPGKEQHKPCLVCCGHDCLPSQPKGWLALLLPPIHLLKTTPISRLVQDANRKILTDLREQLAAHVASSGTKFQLQVIAAYRLLDRLAPAAISALASAELADAKAEFGKRDAVLEAEHVDLLGKFQSHRDSLLHPHLTHPNR